MRIQVCKVIDPANRTGKIFVPIENTHDTLGRAELAKNSKKNISLCLLYQQRRCNAGQKCNQIHADRWFIQKLRKTPSKEGTCCPRHGVSTNVDSMALSGAVLRVGTAEHDVPVECLSRTAFLDRVKKGVRVTLTTRNICRLHQRNGCKFGRNCRHVHLCREVGAALLPATADKEKEKPAEQDAATEAQLSPSSTPQMPTEAVALPPQPQPPATPMHEARRCSSETVATMQTACTSSSRRRSSALSGLEELGSTFGADPFACIAPLATPKGLGDTARRVSWATASEAEGPQDSPARRGSVFAVAPFPSHAAPAGAAAAEAVAAPGPARRRVKSAQIGAVGEVRSPPSPDIHMLAGSLQAFRQALEPFGLPPQIRRHSQPAKAGEQPEWQFVSAETPAEC